MKSKTIDQQLHTAKDKPDIDAIKIEDTINESSDNDNSSNNEEFSRKEMFPSDFLSLDIVEENSDNVAFDDPLNIDTPEFLTNNNDFELEKCFENNVKEANDYLHCHLCDKKIKTKWYMKTHMDTFHGKNGKVPWSGNRNKEKGIFKCIFCDKQFSQKTSVKHHMNKKHKEKLEEIEMKVKNENFEIKTADQTPENHDISLEKQNNVKVQTTLKTENYLESTDLSHPISTTNNLKVIKKEIYSEDEFIGKNASVDNLINSNLLTENKEVSKKSLKLKLFKLKCEVCNKFVVKSYLAKHMLRKHNIEIDEKQFKKLKSKGHECPFCGKKFPSPSKLKRHNRACNSNTDNPKQCSNCGKRFSTPYKLRKHKNIYTECRGPKQKYCSFCDKTFPTPSKLQRHLFTHTG